MCMPNVERNCYTTNWFNSESAVQILKRFWPHSIEQIKNNDEVTLIGSEYAFYQYRWSDDSRQQPQVGNGWNFEDDYIIMMKVSPSVNNRLHPLSLMPIFEFIA